MGGQVNALWCNFASSIAQHAQAWGVGGGVVILAFVARWPATIPKTAQEWWTWIRATFQTALPIPHNLSENPSKPEEPAQTK